MKASIARLVVLKGLESNGSDEHPAVITRAWSALDTAEGPATVNVTVFPDCGMPLCKTSVLLFDTRALAEQALVANPHNPVCFWPDRV